MPLKRDGSWVKTQRMNLIAKKVSEAITTGKKLSLKTLLAWISVTIGLTNKTALKYLDELATVYKWEMDENFIWLQPVGEA